MTQRILSLLFAVAVVCVVMTYTAHAYETQKLSGKPTTPMMLV